MHNNDKYKIYFAKLLEEVRYEKTSNNLADRIKSHALLFAQQWNMEDFNRFETHYVRTYIGKDIDSGWETIIMNWQKNNQTSIHGHPDFAYYTVLTGVLLVETFEPIGELKCKKVDEHMLSKGDNLLSIGEQGKFTNHIHRISCVSDKAHSLHIYSGDALLGQVYEVD